MNSDHAYRQFNPNCRTAGLCYMPVLTSMHGLIPPIDSVFSWNVKYKTIKVFQVCSTSSAVCKSLFYILTYSGASSYGNKSIVPCVTSFP